MSKTVFVISIHSVVDIITNSSSEIFVCETGKTIEDVKKFLKNALDLIESNESLEEVIGEPYIVTKENLCDFIKKYNYYIGAESDGYPQYWKMIGELFPNRKNNVLTKRQETKIEKEFAKREKEWMEKYGQKYEDEYIGKLIIPSADDNSVPHQLWEVINHVFGGYNIHIG